jgi:hypothetical protein
MTLKARLYADELNEGYCNSLWPDVGNRGVAMPMLVGLEGRIIPAWMRLSRRKMPYL